jgi:hypothetical protein
MPTDHDFTRNMKDPLYWHFWFVIAVVWLSGLALGLVLR